MGCSSSSTQTTSSDISSDITQIIPTDTSSKIANKHTAPPAILISQLIKNKCVVPSEKTGPYDLTNYHSNITGTHAGFHDTQEWIDYNAQKSSELLACGSWDNVDVAVFDADWAVAHGSQVLGTSFDPMKLHRQRLQDAHTKMVNTYKDAVSSVKNNNLQTFAHLIDPNGSYQSRGAKCSQPGNNDLLQIYAGALNALTPLWKLSNQIAAAAGGVVGVSSLSWSLKGLLRIRKKTNEKYSEKTFVSASLCDMYTFIFVFCTTTGYSSTRSSTRYAHYTANSEFLFLFLFLFFRQ